MNYFHISFNFIEAFLVRLIFFGFLFVEKRWKSGTIQFNSKSIGFIQVHFIFYSFWMNASAGRSMKIDLIYFIDIIISILIGNSREIGISWWNCVSFVFNRNWIIIVFIFYIYARVARVLIMFHSRSSQVWNKTKPTYM